MNTVRCCFCTALQYVAAGRQKSQSLNSLQSVLNLLSFRWFVFGSCRLKILSAKYSSLLLSKQDGFLFSAPSLPNFNSYFEPGVWSLRQTYTHCHCLALDLFMLPANLFPQPYIYINPWAANLALLTSFRKHVINLNNFIYLWILNLTNFHEHKVKCVKLYSSVLKTGAVTSGDIYSCGY